MTLSINAQCVAIRPGTLAGFDVPRHSNLTESHQTVSGWAMAITPNTEAGRFLNRRDNSPLNVKNDPAAPEKGVIVNDGAALRWEEQ
jgi:hypothetical protein